MIVRRHLVPLAAILAAACQRDHGPGVVEVEAQDCYACHRADYDSTHAPVHAGEFPTTCGDCHSTDAWTPALNGGHPDPDFPISRGAHQGIECLECHDAAAGPSTAGANTDCIGCHTGDHVRTEMDDRHRGVPDYAWEGSMPHFCLTCHPSGAANKHPETEFPISGGPHGSVDCYACHDLSLGPNAGGQNVSCIGCHEHNQAESDDHHEEVGAYRWDPTMPAFCRTCHPQGRE